MIYTHSIILLGDKHIWMILSEEQSAVLDAPLEMAEFVVDFSVLWRKL